LRYDAARIAARGFGPRITQRLVELNSPTDLRTLPIPPNMTNHRSSEDKQKLYSHVTQYQDSMDLVRSDIARVRSRDPLHQLLYVFCQSWLVEDLLMKADRMSMANSIELRTPFLDYRIVEWAARSTSRIKVGQDGHGQYVTKRVLRQFANKRLPDEIIRRPKMGFPVPLYNWLTDRLKPWAIEQMSSKDTQIYRWFDPVVVRQQLQKATSPDASLMDRHCLWDLIILELWTREWQPT